MVSAASRLCVIVALGVLCSAQSAYAQTMEVFAGGRHIVDAPATSVQLTPQSLTVGADGRLYVADYNGRLLRFDPAAGTVTVLPGLPNTANVDLGSPYGLAFSPTGELQFATSNSLNGVDPATGDVGYAGNLDVAGHIAYGPDGTLYYASSDDHRIRARLASGEIVVIAGQGEPGFDGDGGPAQFAFLNYPRGIAVDGSGNLYVADTQNSRVRRVEAATGIITTIAGTGEWEYNGDGLPGSQTNVGFPAALAFDAGGDLFIGSEARILRWSADTGHIATVAGTGNYSYSGDGGSALTAGIGMPNAIAFDASGTFYFDDTGYRVRKVAGDTGLITTVLGNGEYIFCGEAVPAHAACLGPPRSLDFDALGNLLIGDEGTERLRQVSASDGLIRTIGTPPYRSLRGIEYDANGNIYLASFDNRVYRIDGLTGARSVVAGNGGWNSYSGDGGPATAAGLAAPSDIAFDDAGNLYFSDTGNHRIRRVSAATGVITTYAGSFRTESPLGDGGPATQAALKSPTNIEFDSAGNLVIVDGQHCRLRKVDAATGIISTIAGNGTCTSGHSGDGGPATATALGMYAPIALDPAGNVFVAWSDKLRRIDAATGVISTIAPPSGALTTLEGLGLEWPISMKFDSFGRLYVGERLQQVVFRISGVPYAVPDSTPPVIELSVAGAAGNNGWYRSDVQLTWAVGDGESSVISSSGCTASSVASDTAGVDFTCTATSGGGTATRSITIKRDTVTPQLTFGAAAPAAGPSGWNTTDVTVPFEASDTLSGVYSTSGASPLTIVGEGAGLSAHVVITDFAGNSAAFDSPSVNIDRTPPTVQAVVAGTAGTDGWYKSDVQVSWSIGELPASIITTNGCQTSTVNADTAGVTFTCQVMSAGGTASSSVTVRRDATAPVLTWGNATPLPNAAGWNKSNVSFSFTRSDALSGVASASSTSPLVVSEEGAGVIGTVTVTDRAGNVGVFTTAPRNIDKTAPTIDLASPVNGAVYGFYSNVDAQYSCTDAVSGTASCTAPVADGAPLNTKTMNGSYSFKVTAKDAAGNAASRTHAWSVAAGFNFEGFLAPANNIPVLNLVTRGTRVPIRWRLPDGNGGFVSNTASYQSISTTNFSCTGDAVPLLETTSGAVGLTFDSSNDTFTYNWNTGTNLSNCRSVVIRLRDGTTHEIRFMLR